MGPLDRFMHHSMYYDETVTRHGEKKAKRDRGILEIITGRAGEKNKLSNWSSGQSFWLQIQRSRVRFPALPDFSE